MTQPLSPDTDLVLAAAPGIIEEGTPGNDWMTGTHGDDTLSGLGGNDEIYGYDGNDVLDGGAGDDYLVGGTGNDTYLFGIGSGRDYVEQWRGAGDVDKVLLGPGLTPDDITLSRFFDTLVISIKGTSDQLRLGYHFEGEPLSGIEFADGTFWDQDDILANLGASEGNDIINGTSGDDELNGLGGDDQIYGLEGNDTLIGGSGNDTLSGGDGVDTYVFGFGSGNDLITSYDTISSGDRIMLGAGVTVSDLTLTRSDDDLIITINGTGERLTVAEHFNGNEIARIDFDDGTIWDADDIVLNIHPTEGNDTLTGTRGNDTINGLGGNDLIQGLKGKDILDGAGGYDVLSGGNGNDLLRGGSENDSLHGGNHADDLQGGTGDDELFGGNGDDTLDGGSGMDRLSGNRGDDTYLFGLGSGMDEIQNNDFHGGNDWVVLGPGVTPDDINMTRSGNSLTLSIDGTLDYLTIQGFFFAAEYAVDGIRFADGTSWDFNTLKEPFMIGNDSSNSISGSFADDFIRGLGSKDWLYGERGDDILNGGLGRDVLVGGADSDAFLFDTALDDSNVDLIGDFQSIDSIQLDNAIFTQLAATGALDADFFAASASGEAVDANDYILYETDTGKLFYDPDGNGAADKVQFARIGDSSPGTPTASDFVVV